MILSCSTSVSESCGAKSIFLQITLQSHPLLPNVRVGVVPAVRYTRTVVVHASFIAALATDLAFGDYNSLLTIEASQSQWVIVSSWGENGDFLSLSLTNIKIDTPDLAPVGLQPVRTYLAVLAARTATEEQEESEYLLVRHRPPGTAVGGIFHPSDGFVRVVHRNGGLTVVAHGRYAHCHGQHEGQLVVQDIPYPPLGYDKARAWHLSGTRRPWVGEFDVSASSSPPRPAGSSGDA
ncbi:MAG TPA: hypothetical protein VHB27_08655 [Rhodopila sp.]|uniref:hypothetical protein n=1 Tax=Rhodopila sp. TaxID=2480087 RepID=UPI002C797886|nr:hypothetical protein [Rhodopila sp.]HVY15284.1 hypothetical protein [Rhodopila sp.]